MSRQELVQGYLDGQMGRRVFIRRLIATGVSAGAALSYANLLEASPAAAQEGDFYLVFGDGGFPAPHIALAQGQAQLLNNFGPNVHDVKDSSGLGLFDSDDIPRFQGVVLEAYPGAGTYSIRCSDTGHDPLKGKVKVPVVVTPAQGPLGTNFNVRWSHATAPSGLVFDVQRKAPGANGYAPWRTGVRARGATFRPPRRGLFTLRARVRRPATGKASGWSDPVTLRVT